MNIVEAGVIAGVPAGTTVGILLCKSYGVLGILGGLVAGLVGGGLAGWGYALIIMGLLIAFVWGWRKVRPSAKPLSLDAALERMTPIGVVGTFLGILASLIFWFEFGWLYAMISASVVAVTTTVAAVVHCERR